MGSQSLPAILAVRNLKTMLTSTSAQFYDKFRIVEANMGNEALPQYQSGHIDKAIYLNTMECVEASQLYPRNLPNRECFRDYVGSLGISNKHHLIFYDRSPFGFYGSSRLWWLFRMYGHEKVSVLNGGIRGWVHSNFELSKDLPTFKKETFTIKENKALVRNFDQVNDNSSTNKEQIVDVRGAHDFNEIGNIPNSKNVPYSDLFDQETGLIKSKEELAKLFQQHGVDLKKPIVTSCLTGMTACSGALAAHILGNEKTAVYYGSWTEYSQREADD